MAGSAPPPPESLDASGLRFAIVAARFNAAITQRLVEGARNAFAQHGAPDVDVTWVPGAFELPLACREVARTNDAVVALGCVIRGETAHFDFVAGEAARGIMQAQMETSVPVAFGVLTTDTHAQAVARAGGDKGDKGAEAALTAIEMARLLAR